ncbi:MAG: hypothetical protein N7Q72_03915, partial [Spiroplasma sp. Tabriz.8]|nr:hypothetical protein [Spiroplasma sp. Tabriz.8]
MTLEKIILKVLLRHNLIWRFYFLIFNYKIIIIIIIIIIHFIYLIIIIILPYYKNKIIRVIFVYKHDLKYII